MGHVKGTVNRQGGVALGAGDTDFGRGVCLTDRGLHEAVGDSSRPPRVEPKVFGDTQVLSDASFPITHFRVFRSLHPQC